MSSSQKMERMTFYRATSRACALLENPSSHNPVELAVTLRAELRGLRLCATYMTLSYLQYSSQSTEDAISKSILSNACCCHKPSPYTTAVCTMQHKQSSWGKNYVLDQNVDDSIKAQINMC